MSQIEKSWQAIDVTASVAAREAIEYGLMEAGALGTETSADDNLPVSVRAYFEHCVDVQTVRAVLFDALQIYNLPRTSLIDLQTSEVPDRDWLAEWKKSWQPVEVGRFIIAPPWIDPVSPTSAGRSVEDRIFIRIDPGMAFGTGTHETTRLCLKTIEKYFRGESLLDVGTGTGILAIAAIKMYPDARVEALDTDAAAIEIASKNAQLNGVEGRIHFAAGSVNEETPPADFVCANLTATTIVEILPSLLGVTCRRLVLSGILASQADFVQSRLFQLGAPILEMEAEDDWITLIV